MGLFLNDYPSPFFGGGGGGAGSSGPSIPEPVFASGLIPRGAFRFFDAADDSGSVDTVEDFYGLLTDLTESGINRPSKNEDGVSSVSFDGSNDRLNGSSLSEYNFVHDPTTDYTIMATVKLPSGTVASKYLWGTTRSTRGFRLTVTAITVPRHYTYGSGSDNTSINGVAFDDSWHTIVIQYDKSAIDFHRAYDDTQLSMDGSHNFGGEVGDADFPITFGRYSDQTIGQYHTAYEIRDWRIYEGLGDTAGDSGVYFDWATDNGLLT